MPARFVLDENLRGPLWTAIGAHNASHREPIDAVRVGDPADLPLGTPDPDLLAWAEREGRIVVSLDVRTMIRHLNDHLAAGRELPGLFVLRPGAGLRSIVDFVALATADPGLAQWQNRVEFIP